MPEILNKVDFHDLEREVGELGIAEIARLYKWLSGGDLRAKMLSTPLRKNKEVFAVNWLYWECRMAPSIICRSEVELFGLSMPRFAYRLTFPKRLGYTNIRRIGTFCGQVEGWLNDSGTYSPSTSVLPWCHPAWTLKRNRCVADAILATPARFKSNEWHILKTPLAKAYGEVGPAETDRDLVPYVRHTSARGGMCAQAVAFMATTLLQQHAKGIYGVAEITALINSSSKIRITGMQPHELSEYFRHPEVALECIPQRSTITKPREAEVEFKRRLRAYLLSNCPVILPVDLGRMKGLHHPAGLKKGDGDETTEDNLRYGESIFKRNGLPSTYGGRSTGGTNLTHAVVAIGCDIPDTGECFLFNDPATFPFMEATGAELYAAASYNEETTNILSGLFLPVTPQAVRMPLATRWKANSADRPGLVDVVHELPANGPEKFPNLPDVGEFRLVRLSHDSIQSALRSSPIVDAKVRDWILANLPSVESQSEPPWVWVQWTSRSVWLWNAQADPPDDFDGIKSLSYLMGAAWRDASNQLRNWPESNFPQKAFQPSRSKSQTKCKPVEVHKLETSIISSYCTDGIDEALRKWPKSVTQCELYAYMQSDAEYFLPVLPSTSLSQRSRQLVCRLSIRGKNLLHKMRFWKPLAAAPNLQPFHTAIDRMAAEHNNFERIKNNAEVLADKISSKGLKIVALATFIPGLAFDESHPGRQKSINALSYACQLAGQLRIRHSELKTVEIVGGSRILGLSRSVSSRRDEPYEFNAHCVSEQDALTNLLSALEAVVEIARKNGLRLALEYEPGPLNALGDYSQIKKFCDLMTKSKIKLVDVVGLNLDVAHWSLLSRLQVNEHARPLEHHFLHSHISNHGRGHFGDTSIENDEHEAPSRHPSEFLNWIKFLDQVCMVKPTASFSGFVSIEMEACKSPQYLKECSENLNRLMVRVK